MIVLIRTSHGVFACDIVPNAGMGDAPTIEDAIASTWDLIRDREPIEGAWVHEIRVETPDYRARRYTQAIRGDGRRSRSGEGRSTETFTASHVHSVGSEGLELRAC